MAKKIGEVTVMEKVRYYDAHQKANEILIRAISKLEVRRLDSASEAEEAKIDTELLDLGAKKALLKARLAAFDAGDGMIEPPTSEQLAKLKELVDAVEQLTVNQTLFDSVLDFAKQGVDIYKKIAV